MKRLSTGILGLAVLFGASIPAEALSVVNSKHNLSYQSTAAIRASASTAPAREVCVFCHIPHTSLSQVPLWNHNLSTQTYTLYNTSSTMDAKSSVGQPDGASKLCLSCHDGTIAIGSLKGVNVTMTGTSQFMPAVSSTGTDLSKHHPVSFVPNLSDMEICNPLAGDTVKLDGSGKIQCTTCHDPHDNATAPFLRKSSVVASGTGGALCTTCHRKAGWAAGSAHRDSTKAFTGRLAAGTVGSYACEACHDPHMPNESVRLLDDKNATATVEEGVCYTCHNGTLTVKNIQTEFTRTYKHPVTAQSGAHQPNENYNLMSPRHAECVDCHNPHGAKVDATVPTRPGFWGSMANVRGVGVTYGGTAWTAPTLTPKTAQYEFEVCFKCHTSYSWSLAPTGQNGEAETDLSKEFNPANKSYHVIAGMGQTSKTTNGFFVNFPGNAWTNTSVLHCSDCHGAAVTDPRDPNSKPAAQGVHGSTNAHLLIAPWDATTGVSGRDTSKHLCFKCHDYYRYTGQNPATRPAGYAITGTRTSFSEQTYQGNLHMDKHGSGKAPGCRACHSQIPHGFENRGLLSFNNYTTTDWRYRYKSTYFRLETGVTTWPAQGNWGENSCNHNTGCG